MPPGLTAPAKLEKVRKNMFHLDQFISQYVTKRPVSMFSADIEANRDALTQKIAGKSVLVIGGAGSIGSSFIKALLPFKPASLVVVDYNENALAELTRDLRSTKGMYVPEDFFVLWRMDSWEIYCSDLRKKVIIEKDIYEHGRLRR